MRKVIFGKVYDTNAASLVGSWDNGERDEEYVFTSLFRKRTGEYFIHTVDAAKNQAIFPLVYESARLRASKHLDNGVYEAEFCGKIEDDSQVVASYRVSASTKAAIQREAARTGETQGQVIDRLAKSLGE